MFEKLKNLFGNSASELKKVEAENQKNVKKPKEKKSKQILTEKERATAAGEPYIAITEMNIDPENINSGTMAFDWNDKFIINLIKAGYKQREDDTDQVLVDRWFQAVCRNVALEVYEQQVADPVNRDIEDIRRIHKKDLGGGRSEIS